MQSGRERTVSSTSREQSLKAVDGRKQDVVPAPEQRRTRNSKDTHSVPAYLEIPTAAGGLENSVWNWETPLEDIGEAESYYYEPQGELLQAVPKAKYTGRDELDPSCDGVRQTQELRHTLSSAVTNTPHADNSTDRRQPSTAPPTVAGVKRKSTSDNSPAGAPSDPKERRVSFAMSETGDESGPSTGPLAPTMGTRSQSARSGTSATESRPTAGEAGTGRKRTATDPGATMALPARKVFPIQIGDKLFRLSGASISSDAPSYFSQFFEEQLRQTEGADSVRTLYIDRDPATFEDISLHLQGYHILPRDGPHFVKLFADAQFFSLPRLTAQLFASTIYIRIGDSEFQIPRDLFASPGDSPNFFSLGFAVFFSSPAEVFPGLSQRTLLRPPSILPPSVPNRSAKTFADLLHILKGYPVDIRNEEHRAELLRDARYYHLKGLEQRLIPHEISYNLARKRSEILIKLEDIRQSGISFILDSAVSSISTSPASSTPGTPNGPGWVHYQRPYVDSEAHSLIFEIVGEESTFLSVSAVSAATSPARMARATFSRQTLARITSLFQVLANKMGLPVTQPLGLLMLERDAGRPVPPATTGITDDRVKVRIGSDADVTVNGHPWVLGEEAEESDSDSEMETEPVRVRKRKRAERPAELEWVVQRSQWRIRVQPVTSGKSGVEVILGAVKIEALSSERGRNATREFLS